MSGLNLQYNNDSQPYCASVAQFETEFLFIYLFQFLFWEFYYLIDVFKPQCKYSSNKFIQILARICGFLASFPMM